MRSIAIQLLGACGATVLGIASETSADWLRSMGATPVPFGDGLADRLRDAAPDEIDAFIDAFGGGYVQLTVELGVPRDRIETIIDSPAAQEFGTEAEGGASVANPRLLDELARTVTSGQVTMPVAASYPLDRVRDAFEQVEQRRTRGKVVLLP